jgi:transcriptional regulator with XRE-family HTH domain
MSSEQSDAPSSRFGSELRRYRKAAGLSQNAVASRLGCTQGQVSRVERGERTPSQHDAEICDQIFGLTDKKYFVGLYAQMTGAPGAPSWFLDWTQSIEPRAAVLRTWDPLLIPGLLQTEIYARFVLSGGTLKPNEVEGRVRARMQRKLVLDRSEPPSLWVLIDQYVLHRPVGDAEVMREQMEYLLKVSERHNVTLQIVPVDSPCTAGLLSPFSLAQMPDGTTTAFVESAAPGIASAAPDFCASLWDRYDRIRAVAYPIGESLKLIKESMERAT